MDASNCTSCHSMRNVLLLLCAAIRVCVAYSCIAGYECDSRIDGPMSGTEYDIEAACDADVKCKSFDFDDSHGYGFKCDTVSRRADAVRAYTHARMHTLR